MNTVLRQKYENLVDTFEKIMETPQHAYCITIREFVDLEKQVMEIRKIQKSLIVEDRT